VAATTTAQGVLSYSDLVSLAEQAGLDHARALTAAAIAEAESGGRPTAHNDNPNTGDNSYGLWQINMIGGLGPARRAQFGIASNDQLTDPLTNAKAMAIISGGGSHWGDWSTYKSGAYKAYLGGGADTGSGDIYTGTLGQPGGGGSFTGTTDNPCLIGDITMPWVVPNIPCLFYKSWGWALLGSLAMVGGALTMMIGAVVIVKDSTARAAAGSIASAISRRTPDQSAQQAAEQRDYERQAEQALRRERSSDARASRRTADTGYRPRTPRTTTITEEAPF